MPNARNRVVNPTALLPSNNPLMSVAMFVTFSIDPNAPPAAVIRITSPPLNNAFSTAAENSLPPGIFQRTHVMSAKVIDSSNASAGLPAT